MKEKGVMSKKLSCFQPSVHMEAKVETAMNTCSPSDRLKIYVLNEDLPTEWFTIMNQRLRQLDSEVINCRMSPEQFPVLSLPGDHIHYATYFPLRYSRDGGGRADSLSGLWHDSFTQDLSLLAADLQGYGLGQWSISQIPSIADGF